MVQRGRSFWWSQITQGITKDLWTHTKFLSGRRIKDAYGAIESPEMESPDSAKPLGISEAK
jgi:hypothetical protein